MKCLLTETSSVWVNGSTEDERGTMTSPWVTQPADGQAAQVSLCLSLHACQALSSLGTSLLPAPPFPGILVMNPADSHCVTLGKSFPCLGISYFLDYCEKVNDHPIFKCILKNIKKVTTWQVGPGSVIYGERQRRQEAKCLWSWKKDHGNLCLLNMSKVLSHCSRLL